MNPDVSLMSTGEWAIAVYQDTYNDYIMAELFEWRSSTNSFNSYSTIKIYQGGINVKIDGFWDSSTGDRWMLVWNKDDQLAVFATAGYYDFNLSKPVIDISKNVILQGNGTSIYSAPDVTILRNNVYFTYNEFDGTNNILTVEKQNWLVIKLGQITTPTNYVLNYSNTDYAYDLPRISSFLTPITTMITGLLWHKPSMLQQVEQKYMDLLQVGIIHSTAHPMCTMMAPWHHHLIIMILLFIKTAILL